MNQIGDYNLIERIGAGGMGEVWRAENVHTHVTCAIKLLPEGATTDANFVSRFFDEGRVMQTLTHPHIVRVHHVGEDKETGRYFLVEDIVESSDGVKSLHDLLEQAGDHRLPEKDVRKWSTQVAEALAYAHEQGVIHRDIKPANVLIDHAGNARVTDFGLAKAIGEEYVQSQIHVSIAQSMAGRSMGEQPTIPPAPENSLGDEDTLDTDRPSGGRTTADALLGTYDYMSPEQRGDLPGVEVGPASDIYAFGVMLYRLLTGRRPTGKAKDPSVLVHGLSKKWDTITDRCLEHRPADRYADGGELARSIAGATSPRRRSRLVAPALLALVVLAGYVGWRQWSEGRSKAGATSLPADPVVVPVREPVAPESASTRQPQPREAPPPGQAARSEVTFTIEPLGSRLTVFNSAELVLQTNLTERETRIALEKGKYELEIQKDGYRMGTPAIEVAKDGQSFSHTLSPLRGGLALHTTPGAEVVAHSLAGGKTVNLGKAGADGFLEYERLVEGHYRLEISHPDHQSASAEIRIRRDDTEQLRKDLVGKPGWAYISASPTAEVWIDGKRQGQTGVQIDRLAAGKHAFEVRKPGYRTERFQIEIPPNGSVRHPLGNLAPESGSIRVSASVPEYAKTHFQGLDKRIRIGSNPWKTVKALPYTEAGLSCEEHAVQLEVEGFGSVRKNVAVRDEQTADALLELEPLPARLTIECAVTDAVVSDAAGQELGRVNQALDVPSLQPVAVTVAAARHAPLAVSLKALEPGKSYRHNATLEKQKGPAEGQALSVPDLGMEFLPVGAGGFEMGSNDGVSDEKRVHRVTFRKPFWMGKTEVTQRQYQEVMGENPSHFKNAGLDAPVERVTWHNAVEFCKKLTERERKAGRLPTGYVYRLPTEAEWEYAARGGSNAGATSPRRNYKYSGSDNLSDVAWYGSNSSGHTQPVGRKQANELGLHDMSGNVWEWCADYWHENYQGAPSDGSAWVSGGESSRRVLRGGSWDSPDSYCRVADRFRSTPSSSNNDIGFRVVLGVEG